MRILFYTLGCKVNQAESGGMGALLRERGHMVVSADDAGVDAVIVNTCTVTAAAGRKSRAAIRRLRGRYPRALLCVCGCLSQTEETGAIAEIDLIGGSANKAALLDALEALAAGNAGAATAPAADQVALHRLPGTFEALPTAPPEGRCRTFLKIQDGCDNQCAYCIIPAARGPSRSRSVEELVREAHKAAEHSPEIILCGIEISSYAPGLAQLVEAICRAVPDTRVRIGSLDPRTPDDDFCTRLAQLENLCPHFHLSLQSCSDTVLSRMNRLYGLPAIEKAFAALRAAWQDPAITADILTGFPGESEREFEETAAALRRLRPAGLHIFPYSRRPGTAAAALPGQITNAQKKARAGTLAALGQELRQAYLAAHAGESADVLYETRKNGVWLGHTPTYMPVYAESPLDLRGARRETVLTGIREDGYAGQITTNR